MILFAKNYRKAVNCKTVSGPALAVCPWEIAISELRVCFILLSLICVFVGLFAIRKESKKTAELVKKNKKKIFLIISLISFFFKFY